jgi:hypothetical protein
VDCVAAVPGAVAARCGGGLTLLWSACFAGRSADSVRYHFDHHIDPKRVQVEIQMPEWIAYLLRQGMLQEEGEEYDKQTQHVLEKMNVIDPLLVKPDSRLFWTRQGGRPR